MNTNTFCPKCSAPLRFFRMMYLRKVYLYVECSSKPSHFRWPDGHGFDSPEDFRKEAVKRGICCITSIQKPEFKPILFSPV